MKEKELANLTGSKAHYEVLDGLRGIAAISIVVFHIFEMVFPDYKKSPLGHGYLAVDFFFCLSGFVIGYAYDQRIDKIGIKAFLRNRFIRLHPLVILGSILGLAGYLFDPFINNLVLAGWGKTLFAFFCSVLLLPSPILPNRYGALFPLNSPSWSLFMEYLANIGYAFFLARLNKRWMFPLLMVSAIWLTYLSYCNGWLIGGWDDGSFFVGLARVTYSFIAGLFVFRFNLILKNRLNFLLIALLLVCFFLSPHYDKDWATEAGLVIFGFPFLLSLGAGTSVKGRLREIAVFIGRLSYPLYMTHIFAIWCFGTYFNTHKPAGLHLVVVIVGLLSSLLALAYLAMRFYDEPIRAFLTRKWVKRT